MILTLIFHVMFCYMFLANLFVAVALIDNKTHRKSFDCLHSFHNNLAFVIKAKTKQNERENITEMA